MLTRSEKSSLEFLLSKPSQFKKIMKIKLIKHKLFAKSLKKNKCELISFCSPSVKRNSCFGRSLGFLVSKLPRVKKCVDWLVHMILAKTH